MKEQSNMSMQIIGYFVIINYIQLIYTQIAFPIQIELSQNKLNFEGRLPLYTPARCGENELLYPGDQRNDWICDCEPGAIYHPDSDACYPAYRLGPCAKEEYLVLLNTSALPICMANDCKIDGQVRVTNVCYKLGQIGPCKNSALDVYILSVNPSSLMLDCVKLNIDRRFDEIPHQRILCENRGSKKFIKGNCATTIKPSEIIKATTTMQSKKKS